MSRFTPINAYNGAAYGQQNARTQPPVSTLIPPQRAGSFYVAANTPVDTARANPAPAGQAQPDFYGWTPYMVNGVITSPDSGPAPVAGTVNTVALNPQAPAPAPTTVTLAQLARMKGNMDVDEVDELVDSDTEMDTRAECQYLGHTFTPRRKRPPTSGRGKKAPNSKGGK